MQVQRTASLTAARQRQVADQLRGRVRVNDTPIATYGAVARATGSRGGSKRAPTSITYTLTNGTGGALTYVLGDPRGLVAGALGVTWTQPTAVKGQVVAAVQGSFDANSVSVKGMNISVTDVTVLDQMLRYVSGDVNGSFSGDPINIDEYRRNTADIPTLMTLDFGSNPYILDTMNCITYLIPAGEGATVTLLLGEALR